MDNEISEHEYESDYYASDAESEGHSYDDVEETFFHEKMTVYKRDGTEEDMDFNKINERLIQLAAIEPKLRCNVAFITQATISTVKNRIKTTEIDEHSAEIANNKCIYDPDFGLLAARIRASNHQKNTLNSFCDTMELLYKNKNANGLPAPRLNEKFIKFVRHFKTELNAMIKYSRDFTISYVGFETIMSRYLLKRSLTKEEVEAKLTKDDIDRRPQDFALERPQDMYMRCACALHMNRTNIKDANVLKDVERTYNLLSLGFISLATPMLFNLGTITEQLLSCFLTCCEDSANGIKLLEHKLALISKNSGGISWWWNLRSRGAEIKSTNGASQGAIPFMRGYEDTSKSFDQGGKRPGSFVNYIQPQDPIFPEWIKLKRKNNPKNMEKLHFAIMMPDLFMEYAEKALEAGDTSIQWYFFDAAYHDDMYKMYGKQFHQVYEERVAKKEYQSSMSILELWKEMETTWMQTSEPYVISKEQANERSNQMNIGTIMASNLCAEIVEVSIPTEYDKEGNIIRLGEFACCDLGCVCLPKYVVVEYLCSNEHKSHVHTWSCPSRRYIDHDRLHEDAGYCQYLLDKMIDISYYPVAECENSNKRHRPVAVGVQGQADLHILLRQPFTSKEAQKDNKEIYETISHGCWENSNKLAQKYGPYPSYFEGQTKYGKGCPMANGIFPWQLSGLEEKDLSGKWDWNKLRKDSQILYNGAPCGYRNSLVMALPPTATTSLIQGNNECLDGNTPILNNCGLSIKIKNFNDNNHIIYGWNDKNIVESTQTHKLNQGMKDTIKLKFEDGREIICTPNHKLLTTNNEWIEAEKLSLNDSLICSIDGAIDHIGDDEKDYELKLDGITLSMDTIDNRYKCLAFARILGYILTDGTIGKDKQTDVRIFMGSLIDANSISRDIELFEGKMPKIKDTKRVFSVRLHTKLIRAIKSLEGIMFGKRSNQENQLPKFLLDDKCPKSIIREFLGGYFGGDGCMPRLSKKSTLRGVKLELTIHKDKQQSMKIMFEHLQKLLDKLNVTGSFISGPFKMSKANKLGNQDNVIYRLSLPINTTFADNIGVRYCIGKLCKLSAAQSYWRYKETITNNTQQVTNYILGKIKVGGKSVPKLLLEAEQIYGKHNATVDTIKYYKKIGGYNISNRKDSGMTPVEYMKYINCNWFDINYAVGRTEMDIPHFTIKLMDKIKCDTRQVWDLSIDKTHSFLANGIMVHNCHEPYSANINRRTTLAGENITINKHLLKELIDRGLWNPKLKKMLMESPNGSVQKLPIPDDMKELYKTVWEYEMSDIIDMMADRGKIIDQTASNNQHMMDPTPEKITNMIFYAWRAKLKTLLYYLRFQFSIKQQGFTENLSINTDTDLPVCGPNGGCVL